jgi:hypothetical protein
VIPEQVDDDTEQDHEVHDHEEDDEQAPQELAKLHW